MCVAANSRRKPRTGHAVRPSIHCYRPRRVPIKSQRSNGLYTAEVTPLHGRESYWRTLQPVSANELLKRLRGLGCHTTDIGDAFFDAYPDWVRNAGA